MVTITDKTLCISLSDPFPVEALLDIQKGIITALKEQYRNPANEEAATGDAETLSGNFALLTLLECTLPTEEQMMKFFKSDESKVE